MDQTFVPMSDEESHQKAAEIVSDLIVSAVSDGIVDDFTLHPQSRLMINAALLELADELKQRC